MIFSKYYNEADFSRPRDVIFLTLSGNRWLIEGQENLLHLNILERNPGNLLLLDILVRRGFFNSEGAGNTYYTVIKYGITFVIVNKEGSPITITTVTELAEKIDWNNPVATVVLSEQPSWICDIYPYPSNRSWYEFLGYERIACRHSIQYVKRNEIPTDWMQCGYSKLWHSSSGED